MNRVELVGRLARDPETRTVEVNSEEIPVGRLTVAVDQPWNDEGADFPTVQVWRQSAKFARDYLEKGDQVAVTGRIETGSYEDNNGETQYYQRVRADRIEGLGNYGNGKSSTSSAPPEVDNEPVDMDGDDEIPF